MLSSVQENFMEIVGYSVKLKKEETLKLNIHTPEQVKQLMEMAKEQHMLSMVYDVVAHLQWNEACKKVIDSYKKQAVLFMMEQTRRTKMFLEIYNVLLEHDIKPVVVKGIVLRSMYPKPDCRYSNDEDLLIDKDDFWRCHNILLNEGYRCEIDVDCFDKNVIPYEVAYFNTKTKVRMEIHTELLPEEHRAFKGLNKKFNNSIYNAQQVNVGMGTVWTLNNTDHFLFLLSHSYKHFIYCGFGIRQLCDLLLMAEKCSDTIDWDYIENTVRENRIDKFLVNLMDIGEKYIGFDCNFIPLKYDIQPDSENLLDDMFDAGVFGKSSMGRIHSANITMDAVDKSFANKTARISIINALFPSKSYMKQNFSYLKKKKYLLPFAYCQRMAAYLKERKARCGGTEETDSIAVGKRRMELMRQYGVI